MKEILDLIACIEEDVSYMRYDSSRIFFDSEEAAALQNSIDANTDSIIEHLRKIKEIISKGV